MSFSISTCSSFFRQSCPNGSKDTITTVKLQVLRDAFKEEKTICRYLIWKFKSCIPTRWTQNLIGFTLRGATREIFSPFQWSLVQSSNLNQFCTPLPPSLHPFSYSFCCVHLSSLQRKKETLAGVKLLAVHKSLSGAILRWRRSR
jgi:hypothetical protein